MPPSDEPRHHPSNQLNDLTGRDWLRFTRTWFEQAAADAPEAALQELLQRFTSDLAAAAATDSALHDLSPAECLETVQSWFVADSPRYHRNKTTELHPARYPEEMVARFVRFFTKSGGWVLDPFAGSGATLVSCLECGRRAVGWEVNPRYADTARARLGLGVEDAAVVCADSRHLLDPARWPELACDHANGLPQFDFSISSPPYFNMLRTARGNVVSSHRQRAAAGLDTHYSELAEDLGNLTDYDTFVAALAALYNQLPALLKPGHYAVIVVQNLRDPAGDIRPLAWDLARAVNPPLRFQGEQIWCQNSKRLGIWGYPKVFVPNYHHHYCLIFRHEP
ncbi:MAG: hypothetical protein IT204_20415 [Fimbriimonadaceae bacterium]|nr:hypothetical protein [Fimbriimonadaceae bacterium]